VIINDVPASKRITVTKEKAEEVKKLLEDAGASIIVK
jgi:ribosomal protein L7/L12